jgi:hypothetical protein
MPLPAGAVAPVRRRPGVWLGFLAAVGLFVAGVEFARRSADWFRPAAVAPFHIVTPAADAVVRRGEPVTLSAYLDPTAPGLVLSAAADLVTRAGPGEPESRRRMTTDPATGAFVAVLPPADADFEYRVEAGPAASDWFTVRVADPVDLAPGTAVEVAPPAYAAGVVRPRSLPGFTDLDAVAGSTAAARLRFTRPALSAVLEWRPDAPGGLPETLPVTLDPDGAGGTATVPLREPGTLRLVLANEPGVRKLRTEVAVRVRVRADEPPRFVAVAGLYAAPRDVRPGQPVAVTVTLADDVAVAAAELEVAAGPGFMAVTRLPVTLTGAGGLTAEGRVTVEPLARMAHGEKVRVRLRVTDTRPGAPAATYPPDGWAEWTVSVGAPPPDAQEAFGPRDAVAARLTAGLADLHEAARAATRLQAATTGKGPLPVDHAARLAAARAKLKAAAGALRDAAREGALTPPLRPLAAAVRALADLTTGETDDFLRRATTDDPADRRAALEAAVTRLRQAVERGEHLARVNDRLARARLDADRLGALAAAYTALADRAAADAPVAEVSAERGRLAARFPSLLADSEPLRAAVAAAAGAERRAFADRAAALAAAVHDLDAAADRLAAAVRAAVGAELAAVQSGVADRAAAALGTLGTPARLARVTLPDPAAARAAVGLLAAGRRAEVLTELEKFAQSLDRAADEFDRHSSDPSDGKSIARLLAQWQDDIRGRAAGFTALPAAGKAALRAEQRAVHAAASHLNLPPDAALAPLREAAAVHLDVASRRLEADGAGADQAMRLAAEALTRLADLVPAAADRLARSRPDLDRLRADHESAAAAVEQTLKAFEKQTPDEAARRAFAARVGPLLDRYDPLAARVAALDLPGHEARRVAAADALAAAAADIRAGLPVDVPASVAAARHALDRLRDAVNGQPPVDAQADELARLQAEVAAHPDAHAATQARIAKSLTALAAPEASALLHDAREAVRRAEAAFKDGTDLPRRTAGAAAVLAALADRLAGRRPDADRITAFAAARSRAAAVALSRAGRPLHPDSGEERRQLGREAEELTHTRVGPAGQVLKRRVLDLYARLIGKTEPDRDAAGQAQLGEALAELAAASAGVADVVRAAPPVAPDPAAGYLPSPQLAAPMRELARAQRAVRDRAAGAGAEVAARLRPEGGGAFEELERRQRDLAAAPAGVPATGLVADRLRVGDARTAVEAADQAVAALRAGASPLADRQAELAAGVRALVGNTRSAAARQVARTRALAAEADDLAAWLAAAEGPDDDLRAAAEEARRVARSLGTAADKADAADAGGADQGRREAEAVLAKLPAALLSGAPAGGDAEPGRSVRVAAAAVRVTDPKPDVLRRAARALAAAARAVPLPAP